MQNQLKWSFLEVDEEEWQQCMCSQGTAAAINDCSIGVNLEKKEMSSGSHVRDEHDVPLNSYSRGALVAAAVALLIAAAVGFNTWYVAEQGLSHMERELANVVKLETVQAHAERPEQHELATVESVEFLDGKAMVQAVITRTAFSGQELIHRQTQFYVQTPHGWQPTAPVAAFWGAPQVLDTLNLHFIFNSKDRAAVEQLAPGLDEFYMALRRALGLDLIAAYGRLEVEVLPERVYPYKGLVAGRLRLPSPLLYDLSFDYTAADLLAHLAREALAGQMMDRTLSTIPIKQQWRPLVEALRIWLQYSDALPLAPAKGSYPFPIDLRAPKPVGLSGLLICSQCADTEMVYQQSSQQQRSAAIFSLLDFIVATYGLDVLPALVTGLGRYEDWETLAPAVFGISATELNAAWYAGAK